MKKHVSTVVAACLGLCAGFTLCYICVVLLHREGKAAASARQQISQQEKTSITVTRDGNLYLVGKRVDLSQLASRLKELSAQQPVTIRADSSTDVKRLMEVLDVCIAPVSLISIPTATTR